MSDTDLTCADCGQKFDGPSGYQWHREHRAPSCARTRARVRMRDVHDVREDVGGVGEPVIQPTVGVAVPEDDYTAADPGEEQTAGAIGLAVRAAGAAEIDFAVVDARARREERERVAAELRERDTRILELQAELEAAQDDVRQAEYAAAASSEEAVGWRREAERVTRLCRALEASNGELRARKGRLKKRLASTKEKWLANAEQLGEEGGNFDHLLEQYAAYLVRSGGPGLVDAGQANEGTDLLKMLLRREVEAETFDDPGKPRVVRESLMAYIKTFANAKATESQRNEANGWLMGAVEIAIRRAPREVEIANVL